MGSENRPVVKKANGIGKASRHGERLRRMNRMDRIHRMKGDGFTLITVLDVSCISLLEKDFWKS